MVFYSHFPFTIVLQFKNPLKCSAKDVMVRMSKLHASADSKIDVGNLIKLCHIRIMMLNSFPDHPIHHYRSLKKQKQNNSVQNQNSSISTNVRQLDLVAYHIMVDHDSTSTSMAQNILKISGN